jgi:hypothetical protein
MTAAVHDRAFFLAALARAAGRDYSGRLTIAGVRPGALRPGDPPEKIHPYARLLVMLRGRQRYVLSRDGQRAPCDLGPGDALYWPPHAWTIELWERPCRFLGVVMRREFLRVILVDFPGGPPPVGGTPHAYHTARPLAGAGLLASRALDRLGDGPGGAAGGRLLGALLALAHRQVETDADQGRHDQGGSWATWRRVESVLLEQQGRSPARKEVARAVGIHPTYLSDLCRRHAGRPFGELVGGAAHGARAGAAAPAARPARRPGRRALRLRQRLVLHPRLRRLRGLHPGRVPPPAVSGRRRRRPWPPSSPGHAVRSDRSHPHPREGRASARDAPAAALASAAHRRVRGRRRSLSDGVHGIGRPCARAPPSADRRPAPFR